MYCTRTYCINTVLGITFFKSIPYFSTLTQMIPIFPPFSCFSNRIFSDFQFSPCLSLNLSLSHSLCLFSLSPLPACETKADMSALRGVPGPTVPSTYCQIFLHYRVVNSKYGPLVSHYCTTYISQTSAPPHNQLIYMNKLPGMKYTGSIPAIHACCRRNVHKYTPRFSVFTVYVMGEGASVPPPPPAGIL